MKCICQFLGSLVLSAVASGAFCQSPVGSDPLNLDLETVVSGTPIRWGANSPVTIDSLNPYHGKYSVMLEMDDNDKSGFQTLSTVLPHGFEGKTITLCGYIRTEDVRDGCAGLWLRIDPQQASDFLQSCQITGTTPWTRYEITLPFDPQQTTGIYGGGMLTGKGRAWLDHFSVRIDGKDIGELLRPKQYPADRDTIRFREGSGIDRIRLNRQRIDHLKELGLIWGFLKYYHPAVRAGNFNWDYELFRILPRVLGAKGREQLDAIWIEWIDSLGKIDGEYDYSADTLSALRWIEESKFSPELTAALIKIRDARRADDSYYINRKNANAIMPTFDHENPYESMKYPDAGYRLLTLFRYWNMIQYYFPYKDLIGKDWESVLPEFIPRFLDADNEKEYLLTALAMTAEIHDSHAFFWTPASRTLSRYYGMRKAVPRVVFVENSATVVSFFNDTLDLDHGLEVGDVITRIDTRSVESIVRSRLPLTPGSNYRTQLRDIAPKLLHSNKDAIKIRYVRDGRSRKTVLKTFTEDETKLCFRLKPAADSCFAMPTPDIAYLYPSLLKKHDLPLVWKAIENTAGLIIDLRHYPSEYLRKLVNEYLMPAPQAFVKFTEGSVIVPGAFEFTSPVKIGNPNDNSYKGKVIVLVNERTQSNLEFMAMALSRCPDARVVGSATAGADGNVIRIDLPGGIITMMSGIGVYYPDGGQTQRIGVRIDEVIEPTVEGIKAGRDEVLERAIEIIERPDAEK